MKYENYEKEDWVLQYIKTNKIVDMLNEKFVDEYIEQFNPKHSIQMWGANKCNELSKLLASLYKQGILKRNSIGTPLASSGMPKWIYVYELTEIGERMLGD